MVASPAPVSVCRRPVERLEPQAVRLPLPQQWCGPLCSSSLIAIAIQNQLLRPDLCSSAAPPLHSFVRSVLIAANGASPPTSCGPVTTGGSRARWGKSLTLLAVSPGPPAQRDPEHHVPPLNLSRAPPTRAAVITRSCPQPRLAAIHCSSVARQTPNPSCAGRMARSQGTTARRRSQTRG